MTICNSVGGNAARKIAFRDRFASLAAVDFLRYANTAKLTRSGAWMTYVVTEACIKCKYTDCVEVCPVDCFYEGDNMLVIHPDECIDCGVCEPECPADAIKPDTEPGSGKMA